MAKVIVGVTGTREGMTPQQLLVWSRIIHCTLNDDSGIVMHHGDCIGVDRDCWMLAQLMGWRTVSHPALVDTSLRAFTVNDETRELMHPLDRNRIIVDESDVMFAFPGPNSRGTLYTINYARRLGKSVVVVPPEG